jgi:large subunit ribosomal protein L17
MRHRVAGKQLSRDTEHRKALRRNLAASLFQHGTIRTTVVKAKELRSFIEKIITIARKKTLHARRLVIAMLRDRDMYRWDDAKKDYVREDKTVVQKLFDEIAPRYANRPGGYTRIIHIAERRIGDAGKQVLLQLVEEAKPGAQPGQQVPARTSRRRRRAASRAEAVRSAAQAAKPPESLPQPPQPEQAAPTEEAEGSQPPKDQPAEGQNK